MLWIVDYIDIYVNSSDCLVVEADSREEAYNKAIDELKNLKIPKRYLLNLEEF